MKPLDLKLVEAVRGYLKASERSAETELQRFYRHQIEKNLTEAKCVK